MTNVLVILSGCGVMDGSEIHESVCTLLHLDRHNATVTIAAPDIDQRDVINHHAGEPTNEKRNVLIESARIARGPVKNLTEIHGNQFDAVVLPGGFGAAKNLCSFAVDGTNCEVNPEVARVLTEAHEAGKVIGLICISPTIGAKLFHGAKLTIGNDKSTADAINKMGAKHEDKATTDICVDEGNRIVTTPAYMCAQRIGEVNEGIGKLIDQVLQLATAPTRQPVST